MSKLYMYGTELGEMEQLMMLVPNFMPRQSGMIVMHGIKRGEASKCQPCLYEESSSKVSEISNLINERNRLDLENYKDTIFTCFKTHRSVRLNERLINLARNNDGEIFLNEIHRSRFYSVCRLQDVPTKDRNSFYLATLFLLTADDKLWKAAKDHVYLDRFDFKKMQLSGINTEGYALYQTARTICMGREYIKMDEIADKTLVGDSAFKAIIHAILISNYGLAMLNVND